MALVKPVVFQIVGFKNSGKTTLTTKLIQALKDYGLKVVTIKHHGHGGKPEPEVVDQKDSTRHLSAGALASIVEGEGRLILQTDHYEWKLEDEIKLLEYFHPDVILIEGYKLKDYPKLLLLRGKEDLSLLTKVKNVKVIMYWEKFLKGSLEEQKEIPSYPIHDEQAISGIVETIRCLVNKIDQKN